MSVGAQLHQARKERKLSLGEVSEQTKIQPWVLEALEGDRLQELMSPIYVKGLLTSYARFLHLQPEPLVSQLVWPAPAAEEVQAQLPPPVRQWRVPVRKLAASA
ncbi:MAG: helix-turn-helix domain-containing protein, partial [Candidatus Omnitrophica bacterium]|nr:helix-turn-helix domain-containing protein [Candidatus Omnitrophota bacterium]